MASFLSGMSFAACCFILGLVPSTPGHALSMQSAEGGIQKIVTLLTEMKSTAESDAKKDTDEHEKYMCIAKENTEAKTTAISNGKSMIKDFESQLEENAGKMGTLVAEIAGLKDDIKEYQDSLSAATTQREGEKEAFEAEEDDLKETIALLTEAIKVLGEASAMQEPMLLQVRSLVTRTPSRRFGKLLQKDFFDMLSSLEQVQRKQTPQLSKDTSIGRVFLRKGVALGQSMQEDLPDGLEDTGAAAGAKSYNSQSGTILGMLVQMKDGAEKDLEEATEAEAKAVAKFMELARSTKTMLDSSISSLEDKQVTLAETKADTASVRGNLKRTVKALATDEAALQDLQAATAAEAAEYDDRWKIRTEEIKALGEALKILTADSARSNFLKTLSFTQVRSSSSASLRTREQFKLASKTLMEVAHRHKNSELASLAGRARTHAFGDVKKMMDEMVATLKKQQQTDYDEKESCMKDITKTENDIDDLNNQKEDLIVKKTGIQDDISGWKKQRDTLQSEVDEIKASIKAAGEQRKSESALYQTEFDDQKLTIKLLNSAMNRLKSFYTPDFFLQVGQPREGVSQNGGTVIILLSHVIQEAEIDLLKMKKGEQEKVKDYEEFLKVSTASQEAKEESIADLKEQISSAEGELAMNDQAINVNTQGLFMAGETLQAHHKSCDFLLKSFDVRKQARAEEIDAINNAKAILSGARFD